jgi:hypothetical protein
MSIDKVVYTNDWDGEVVNAPAPLAALGMTEMPAGAFSP